MPFRYAGSAGRDWPDSFSLTATGFGMPYQPASCTLKLLDKVRVWALALTPTNGGCDDLPMACGTHHVATWRIRDHPMQPAHRMPEIASHDLPHSPAHCEHSPWWHCRRRSWRWRSWLKEWGWDEWCNKRRVLEEYRCESLAEVHCVTNVRYEILDCQVGFLSIQYGQWYLSNIKVLQLSCVQDKWGLELVRVLEPMSAHGCARTTYLDQTGAMHSGVWKFEQT